MFPVMIEAAMRYLNVTESVSPIEEKLLPIFFVLTTLIKRVMRRFKYTLHNKK